MLLRWLASLRDGRRYPPPGFHVDAGGLRLHFHAEGEGAPTVVLDSALAGTSLSWSLVQPAVAAFTKVVSYDRGGFGWSDPSTAPRRVDELLAELRRGLAAASLPPPYVLVGHSYGGFVARFFASRHPKEVAAMVLVDVPHPREWSAPGEEQVRRIRRGAQLSRRGAALARLGITRHLFRLAERGLIVGETAPGEQSRIQSLLGKVPESKREIIRSFWVRPFTLDALASLIENAPSSAALVEDAKTDLGNLPLRVLTASGPSPERIRDQEEVARLSSRGRHLVARSAGHWIPFDEPELVVESIREVVLEARELDSSPPSRGRSNR
ncbi:MAG: alpha/beta fold hydrolase [Vicinamibacteria bacterium]